jgi:hypothetical protein
MSTKSSRARSVQITATRSVLPRAPATP